MTALIVLQIAKSTDADQCLSVLVVGGIILLLFAIKAFGNHVGRWDGVHLGDIRDGETPDPIPQKKRRGEK